MLDWELAGFSDAAQATLTRFRCCWQAHKYIVIRGGQRNTVGGCFMRVETDVIVTTGWDMRRYYEYYSF